MAADGPASMAPASSSPSTPSVCGLASYDASSRLISSSYPRLGSFYASSPYAEQSNYMSAAFGSSASSFYPSLGHPYDLKEAGSGTWSSNLPQTTCYPYETGLYNPYGDRYAGMDSAARRKNATRETTNTLKAWLYEHRKNPYPTKGEKIMLAIITKMTLTQVSTWFANARRRLKKENKMTWEPRNKTSDGQDMDDKESCNGSEDNSSSGGIGDNTLATPSGPTSRSPGPAIKSEPETQLCDKGLRLATSVPRPAGGVGKGNNSAERSSFDGSAENSSSTTRLDSLPNGHHHHNSHHHQNQNNPQQQGSKLQLLSPHHIKQDAIEGRASPLDRDTDSTSASSQRPKIWSLAQTATSERPAFRLAAGDWPGSGNHGHSQGHAQSQHQQLQPGAHHAHLLASANSDSGATPDQFSCPPRHHGDGGHVGPGGGVRRADHWPDESSISLLSSPISANYAMPQMPQAALSSRLVPCPTFPTSFSSTTGSHLGSAANENFAGFPPPHPYSCGLINGSRNPGSGVSPEVSLSPPQSALYSGSDHGSALDASRTNTFLGRVFSDYVSAGQCLDMNGDGSDRGGGEAFTDGSPSPPRAELGMRPSPYAASTAPISAFKPMKR